MEPHQRFSPIDGNAIDDRFALSLGPDGVYRIEGRMIPIRDDRAEPVSTVDDCQPIIPIHCAENMGICHGGIIGRMHIE